MGHMICFYLLRNLHTEFRDGVVMLRFNGTTESHPLPQSSENIGEEEAERLRESDVLKLLQNCDSCSLAGPLYT